MTKTRSLAKGKFHTREELIMNAFRLRHEWGMSYASIARNCGISNTTAVKILKSVS